MPLDSSVDLSQLAQKVNNDTKKQTEMYSGADIENMCREAAMNALRRSLSSPTVVIHSTFIFQMSQDFERSLATTSPSLNASILRWYQGSSDTNFGCP